MHVNVPTVPFSDLSMFYIRSSCCVSLLTCSIQHCLYTVHVKLTVYVCCARVYCTTTAVLFQILTKSLFNPCGDQLHWSSLTTLHLPVSRTLGCSEWLDCCCLELLPTGECQTVILIFAEMFWYLNVLLPYIIALMLLKYGKRDIPDEWLSFWMMCCKETSPTLATFGMVNNNYTRN